MFEGAVYFCDRVGASRGYAGDVLPLHDQCQIGNPTASPSECVWIAPAPVAVMVARMIEDDKADM